MNTYTSLDLQELAGDVEALPPVPGKKSPGNDSEEASRGGNGHPGPVPSGAQIGALGAQIGALQATPDESQPAPNGTKGRERQGSYEKTGNACNSFGNRALGVPCHQLSSPGTREKAEEVGFEPTVPRRGTPVFETGPFNHSGTPPDHWGSYHLV